MKEEIKMNVALIKQFADLRKALKEEGVYGIIDNQLQVSSSIIKGFDQLQVKTRTGEYPFEVFAEVAGIKIFCIVKADEIKEFAQIDRQVKDQLKADLLNQISYLEEDVILDGMEDGTHAS
jgi:peptide subunit release factor RF-3